VEFKFEEMNFLFFDNAPYTLPINSIDHITGKIL
jgi:hypothetical protein